ncbi:thioredoxin domain-containing protein [Salinisphaera sp. P385]|uniref:Thioredoxin domain-containing protein n=1 Tax=Spectribacter acetivorans TaxID=3075603 RepID=A0ABU3BAS4_9GAMM|nr:thioredoxin domain-containing protein [Salinisphaera sp. P385]MDT0619215.1 thioredoxin domain-containing protein [Salinisphaera sp. P385]
MTNRLTDQTSPYLRQHADNPVDWWPWCDEALATARAEDKPVLLSVGYSACHWCHVMAHESFEDDSIAALMNAHFVNIKVDREERPDLDKIYQMAHQILTQRPGGWPLTVVIDPHTQTPFMAGTYFPATASLGMPGFADVLRQVSDWYAGNQHQLTDQKQRLAQIFARLEPAPGDLPDQRILERAGKELAAAFDKQYGGFGGAPKFPHPGSLALATRLGRRGDERAARMAGFSLERMADGGLFDHLGGGFFRYSVDDRWEIPHFEKMLYDNGPLLAACAQQGLTTTAHATADWVLREMTAPEGGFYSSLDADSDGREGAFYVWSQAEVESALGDAWALFAAAYGLDRAPNFEGHWHLQRRHDDQDLADRFGLTPDAIDDHLAAGRQTLFEQRAARTRPDRDDKILTSWNALMIGGLFTAADALDRADCATAADDALAMIRQHLWCDGRLLAVHAGGRSHTSGFLDDYAFLLDALLTALRTRWHSPDLAWATDIADALLAHFADDANGGFYFTPDDHEPLLHRPRPFQDESTPAGNAVAARALLHLGWLIGEPRYLTAAERTLAAGATLMNDYPMAHSSLLLALDEYLDPPPVVILRGADTATARTWRDAATARTWRDAAAAANPLTVVYSIAADADLPAGLADKRAEPDGPVAYVCRGTTCAPPTRSITELDAQLG